MKRDSELWNNLFVAIVGGTIATVVGGIILYQLTSPSQSPTAIPAKIAQATATLAPTSTNPTAIVSTSVPTSAPTVAPTPVATPLLTATSPPATPTNIPTATPRAATPTPTLGIGSTKISADGAVMVYVPAGKFWMGSSDADKQADDDERPQHEVDLDAVWIDKFEVTNAQYKRCVDAGKCSAPRESKSYTRSSYYGNAQYDNYPAIYVTWENATQYCAFAKKQLPTEAQWEKAARGADKRIYPWGDTFDGTKLNSWDSTPRPGDTTAVGSYPSGASPYGAMDMAGNVWEWVADWYDANYYKNSPARNPKNETAGPDRVVRGGSWLYDATLVRAAGRIFDYPVGWFDNVGFRCVE